MLIISKKGVGQNCTARQFPEVVIGGDELQMQGSDNPNEMTADKIETQTQNFDNSKL